MTVLLAQAPARGIVSKAAGPRERAGDRVFQAVLCAAALSVVALASALGFQLAAGSRLLWRTTGPAFLWGTTWDPVAEVFGALPFIFGTLVTSALALLIAVPLGVGAAVFLAEMAPRRAAAVCSFLIELLAAVPSVIIGLMGIFVLVPAVRAVEPFLISALGWTPFFSGAPYGVGVLSAGLVLAAMILPYITSITREVLLSVPQSLKEGALALGATRWESVRTVSLPYARSAVLGAVFLALGRALGETMAVTMVIGNTPKISASLLDPGYSMAAVIANEFAEATSDAYVHALIGVGLVLFVLTLVINGAARWMIHRLGTPGKGAPR
ncbi:MAG: phosphate ABC transporter permease subunit PstC [Elusimicrobiota bacterium]